MTEDRDTELEVLFAEAEEMLHDATFEARVVAGIGAKGGKVRRFAFPVVLLAVAFGMVLLASPLQLAVQSFGELMTRPLVAVDPSTAAFALAPVNMIAFPAGIVLLGIWTIFRKVFA